MKKKYLFLIVISFIFFASCDTLLQSINQTANNFSDGVNNVTNDIQTKKDSSELLKNLDEETKKLREDLKKEIDKAKEKIKNSYNVTDFNYAISYGDNSSLYESKENFSKTKSYAYYLVDPKNIDEAPPIVQGRNHNTTGEFMYASEKFQSAEIYFTKALSIYETNNLMDSIDASLTISNLGLLYHTTGRYTLSEEYTKKALEKRENNPENNIGLAASVNNLAVLYKDMGKYSEAEQYIKQAAQLIEQNLGTDNMKYAIVLNNQAMLYQSLAKYEDAEKLLLQSLQIAEQNVNEKSATYSRLNVNLALLYQEQKKYNEAESIYLETREIKKRQLGTNHPDYAMLLRNLASLYQEMEKFQEVEELLTEAIEIYKEKFGEEHPLYAKASYELGIFYQTQAKYEEAEIKFNIALKIQHKTLGKHHPDLSETNEYLAINYWHKKEYDNAIKSYNNALDEYIYQINTYFGAMNEVEKVLFWNKIHPKFIRFYSFATEIYQEKPAVTELVYNYHISTKALLLNSSRKVKDRILNSNDQELIDKYNEWQDLKNYTGKLYAISYEELQEKNINLDSLEQVVLSLEKELTILSDDFKQTQNQKTITYKNIAEKLNSNDASIEIIRIQKYDYLFAEESIYYLTLTLTNSGYPKMLVYKDGIKKETAYIAEYKKSIMTGKNMAKYYDYFWENMDENTASTKNLYVSVDGIYNQLNINTIELPSGNYIIDEKNVYYVTNTKDVISLKDKNEENESLYYKSAVLLGFPDYKMDIDAVWTVISPLPGTKVEVENIQTKLKANSWNIEVLMDKDATEENIKKVKNPYVLHIATHGYFIETESSGTENTRAFGIEPKRAAENPLLRSGLLLAGAESTVQELDTKNNIGQDDGILNAFEAMILELDQTEIVILSACQTGLGDIKTGEGVYGLQRSFQIAGAESVITSLWEVSDEGTQDLMSAFYGYWLESGDKYEAFQKAQIDIKKKYKYPFYWGAFILVGH